jgi:hypothetical protein
MPRIEFFARCAALEDLACSRETGRLEYTRAAQLSLTRLFPRGRDGLRGWREPSSPPTTPLTRPSTSDTAISKPNQLGRMRPQIAAVPSKDECCAEQQSGVDGLLVGVRRRQQPPTAPLGSRTTT